MGLFIGYWWLLLLLPATVGILSYLYSKNQTPIYEASSELLVQQRRGDFAPGVSDFSLSQELASMYARMVRTTPFLEKVVSETDLVVSVVELRGMIKTKIANVPPTVEIRVESDDPKLAFEAADTVARQFIDHVVEQRLAEIARLQAAAAAQGIGNINQLTAAQFTLVDSLTILEPVSMPTSPILPRTRQNVFVGVLLGTMLAIAGTLILSTLSDTVRDPEEIRRRFGVTVLGAIFQWSSRDAADTELIANKAPSSGFAESFRQVRANFQFATVNNPGAVYLMTSPGASEGKSTVLSNLAVMMAQTGKRVVIVDGDLRRPSVHRLFSTVQRDPGLSNFLVAEETQPESVIQETGIEGVSVVCSGVIPPNPSEILGAPKMSVLFAYLRENYDVVLVDSPPVLMVSDSMVLTNQVDGVMVLVDGSGTRAGSLGASLDTLRSTQAEVVGVILNKLRRARFGYSYAYQHYYYNYYYYYGTEDSQKKTRKGAGRFPSLYVSWVKSIFSRSRGPSA